MKAQSPGYPEIEMDKEFQLERKIVNLIVVHNCSKFVGITLNFIYDVDL